jgi:hypothetical protein
VKSTIKNAVLGSAFLVLGAFAWATAANASPITVLGTADIWAWNGIAPPDDQSGVPTVSIAPALAISNLAGITSVTIAATGETGNGPGLLKPNGTGLVVSHVDGAYNGVPNLSAPLDSLVGAWVNPLNSSFDESFEIGTGGTFIVPIGATELFLGSMDASQWNNNPGQFAVNVTENVNVPEPFTLSLFGAGLFGAAGLRRRRKRARA